MRRKYSPMTILIFALLVIGIAASIRALLIPIIVVGIIVFLYYFPPSRWRINRSNMSAKPKYGKTGRREAPKKKGRFKVIQGSKPDDPNEPPTYH
jgi:hypothetical protein